MRGTAADFIYMIGSRHFWRSTIKLALLVLIAIAVLALAFTTLLVVFPLALVGGIVLHFYLRRKIRQAQQTQRRFSHDVIEAEYTVIDRR